MRKGEGGITLIALVITIIVMLILAGVTINLAVGGGLFNHAQNAVDATKGTQADEQAMAIGVTASMLNPDGDASKFADSIAKAVKDTGFTFDGTNTITDTATGKSYTIASDYEVKEAKINIGDYVDYEKYVTSKTYTAATADTGYTSAQTFTADTSVKWRVLDITNNQLVLVSDTPVNASNGINSNGLYLKGAIGYNNAETVLNNMCRDLYGTAKGTGRSMTFADAAKVTGWDKVPHDDAWAQYWWGTTLAEYKQGLTLTNAYRPDYNNGTMPDSASYTFYNDSDYFALQSGNTIRLLNTQPSETIIKMIFGPDGYYSTWNYWLASHSILTGAGKANFRIGYVGWHTAYSGFSYLFGTDGIPREDYYPMRPIITLNSGTQLVKGADVNGVAGYNIQ